MTKDWIAEAFALLRQPIADGDIAARLTSAGCSPVLADKLVLFLPLACGRVVLAGTGVTLSSSYRLMRQDDSVGEPISLISDPIWRAVDAFVQAQRAQARDAVGRVGRRSAEFDAVNKAALNGSQLSDLVGCDPILFFEPEEEKPTPKAPWWAFWRRAVGDRGS